MKCPYCSAAQPRCATTLSGRQISECTSCGRVVEERQTQSHHLFHLRAQDSPLNLVTSDLPTVPPQNDVVEEDPFEQTGFISSFSTWSLEPYPIFTQSSMSFSGHLAELERVLEATSSSNSSLSSGPSVVVDNLRAYLQIIDVASILRLDSDISEHAFQLFRDCSSATCLRNRSVEALATAALVQAIREAQEPRTLQEISLAANLPQKEIGKYIKILGEALQLSQPINSNSISVHMPRFCTLLQLNKSAQELATHIGEVVINKCFCTRRNPISISAAAIYLACQLEDKRKTQAEICKVTGLTEVTLRKVYKELLENWDDLLPSNYTPAVPPEKAFPTATISSGRTTPRSDYVEGSSLDKEKQPIVKPVDISEAFLHITGKDDIESKDNAYGAYNPALQQTPAFWKLQLPSGTSRKPADEKNENLTNDMDLDKPSKFDDLEKKAEKESKFSSVSSWQSQFSSNPAVNASSMSFPVRPQVPAGNSPSQRFLQIPKFNSVTTREAILERKRQKATDLAAAALAAEENAARQIERVETLALDQGEKSLVVTPPISSPLRESGSKEANQDIPIELRKRLRSGDKELNVYSPQWGVLETDQIIVPVPFSAKNVGPDLCRGLILPADRSTIATKSDVEACTEMMTLLSMGAAWSAVVTERVEGIQIRLKQIDQLEVRAVKAEEDLRNSSTELDRVSGQAETLKSERDALKEELENLKITSSRRIEWRNTQLKQSRKSARKLNKQLLLTEERCYQMGYDDAVVKAHSLGFDHTQLIDAETGMTDPVGKEKSDDPEVVSSGEDEPLSDEPPME